MVGRGDFGAHRTVDDLADFPNHLQEGPARFGHQGRVGGYAVEKPGRGELADFVNVRRVDEELHAVPFLTGDAA